MPSANRRSAACSACASVSKLPATINAIIVSYVLIRPSSAEFVDREYRQRQENGAQDNEKEEQDFGYFSSTSCDAGEPQEGSDDRYDEEYKRPFQHGLVSSV